MQIAAEGPQPQRELNEFVRELKTDDFNQQGEKKMTSWPQLTEGGSVWLPGPAREALPESLVCSSASSAGLPCKGPALGRRQEGQD